MGGRRVLITGASRFWGAELAACLEADPEVELIVGVDRSRPRRTLARTEFVTADLRHSLLGRLVRALGIDTVVHTGVILDPRRVSARSLHEINVIGTMNLLAGCSGVDSPVRRLVVRSSTAIYGAFGTAPLFWTETMRRGRPAEDRITRDLDEIEAMVRDVALRQPRTTVVVLRMANVLGGRDDHPPLDTYLSLPIVPTVLGFDPRLQVINGVDAIEALRRATVGDQSGVFNVAGEGTIPLSQAVAMAGGRRVPLIPAAGRVMTGAVAGMLGMHDFPSHLLSLFRYGRAVDTRAMAEAFDWHPCGTLEVVQAWADGRASPSAVEARRFANVEEIERFLAAKGSLHLAGHRSPPQRQ